MHACARPRAANRQAQVIRTCYVTPCLAHEVLVCHAAASAGACEVCAHEQAASVCASTYFHFLTAAAVADDEDAFDDAAAADAADAAAG